MLFLSARGDIIIRSCSANTGGARKPSHRRTHARAPGGSLAHGVCTRATASALALVACVWVAPPARAQDTAEAPAAEPSAQDRQAAADAFDRGTRAFLARDYPRAGQWFETAYRMAPAAVALIGAVRAHERGGNERRAATLALRLEAVHGDDADAARQAQQTLRAHASTLVRVDVVCEGECTVELDGTLMEHPSFFVAPSTEHVVRATFSAGSAEQPIAAAAGGETRELRFEAPPPPEPVAVVDPAPEPIAAPDARDRVPVQGGGGGISPAFAITGLVLTAIGGGVLVWSGIDTMDGVPAYELDPTPARLADGQERELRTNVLIGVTAGLAAVTVLLAIFTDWDGSPSEQPSVQALVAPIDGGAAGFVGGRF